MRDSLPKGIPMETVSSHPMPSRQPVAFITACITAIILVLAVAAMQVGQSWTPFQRYLLPDVSAYALAKAPLAVAS